MNQQTRSPAACSHRPSSGVGKNAAHWSWEEILIEARSVFAAPSTGANITPGVTGSPVFFLFSFLSFLSYPRVRAIRRHKTTSRLLALLCKSVSSSTCSRERPFSGQNEIHSLRPVILRMLVVRAEIFSRWIYIVKIFSM